jgi:hypothetical protein
MAKYATGKYARAISDRSGMEFPYKEMVREWNGSFVHVSEFEPKQPQLEPKPMNGDSISLRNVRPDRVEPAVPHLLTRNAFSSGVRDSIVVNVFDPDHGYETNDVVRFKGAESKFPEYPQVSRLEAHDVNVAQGHVVTKIDNDNFSFSPNDTLNKFLTDNCIPGTTTLFVDMDGVLTEYYNAIATYATSQGLLESGGDWYDMSPTIEGQAVASIANAGFFANLAKRAEADALIDLCIAKNGSYRALTTDAGVQGNSVKTTWLNTNFTGARAAAGIDFATNFNKGPYGGPNKLLIDDRTTYINQFEAAGGKGFKYYESGGILKFGGDRASVGPVTILA